MRPHILWAKRISMLTGLKKSTLACQCTHSTDQNIMQREGKTKEFSFKGLKYKNEIYQRIELIECVRKMRSFVQLSCLHPGL